MAKREKVKKIENSTLSIADLIVAGMQEVKAHNIVVMDLRKVHNAFTDYFVICTGNSDTQIDAIADSVEKFVFEAIAEDPAHKEGKTNREWILLDYIDVVVNIFKKEKRDFYKLEALWGDAEIIQIPEA
jgi:ribosome-associated protein